ncbi:co-chaperone GroES [Fructilactobacillus sanfranciscensis]|uniref:Co-chaperonin GroES n=2 Tax=Fructilactobacillus sanfranciscensis TaxID=1625 RepID=G2KVC7_FRUST|nr:co-chaperone GroES [Fructilactobacillus sanfranciscensis]AEN98942.1 10 kDa chaperonin [Fructilactobacillus sanfranciscensis TMW 1.1304]MCG7194233.1 co-chaperone GroES [Fructilactobacillus sanfranciscensis]MCG7195817.1 co-chaperone GroES [Fructilactobacillus sanfranciscensis]MDN4462494.1 co-chaperone GroES [Fructilactobacillus sanfranciscensis]MVF15326.1 co-chaperone GroES [Fructilactobacillus sanfranciscensis]
MLQPIGDRVIIEVKAQAEKNIGGIVLAENAKQKPTEGKIVAVGTGRILDNGEKIAPVVKEGDVVMFDKYAGTKIEYDEKSYLVMHENDLLAIIK